MIGPDSLVLGDGVMRRNRLVQLWSHVWFGDSGGQRVHARQQPQLLAAGGVAGLRCQSLTTLAGLVNLALTVSSAELVSFAGGRGQFGRRRWSVRLVPVGICLAACSTKQFADEFKAEAAQQVIEHGR